MTGRAQWPLYALAAARESGAEMAGHHGCETPNGRANAYGMQESAVAYPSMFDEDGPQVWECNDASRLSAPALARLRIGNVQVRVTAWICSIGHSGSLLSVPSLCCALG